MLYTAAAQARATLNKQAVYTRASEAQASVYCFAATIDIPLV